jgi:hypothetical protein
VRRGPRHAQAALAEECEAAEVDRLAHRRQHLGEEAVPDEQLQQQRHVAHHLDIARGELREQPVRRQAGDADQRAEHRREHDADRGDQQGVDDADQERPVVRVGRLVLDVGLGDLEAGLAREEAEAGLDLPGLEVVQRVGDQPPADADDGGQQQHLVEDVAGALVAEHGGPR